MRVYTRHDPFRGSNVEAWLKWHRDAHDRPAWEQNSAWGALDDLLEEYRLCADLGADLMTKSPDGPS